MITVTYNKAGKEDSVKTMHVVKEYVEVDRIIQPGEQGVKIEWLLDGDTTDIVRIQPGCGCTNDITTLTHSILANFNESTFGVEGKNTDNGYVTPDEIKLGYKHYSKSLTVFFDDGQDLYVQQGPNNTYNPNKTKITLSFGVKVDISKFVFKPKNNTGS